MSRYRSMALLAGAVACTTSLPRSQPTVGMGMTATIGALEADSVGNLLLARLLDAENRFVEPDTLFAPETIVVADGEPRVATPRLAGSRIGGQIQLVSTRLSARGGFVWGVFEYRWVPRFNSDALSQGLATVVIGLQPDGGWRILHLHSSSPTEVPRNASTPGTPGVDGVDQSR